MLKSIFKFAVILLIAGAFLYSCGKKEENKTENSMKTDSLESVTLKIKPKVGEKNYYSMIINQKKVLTQVDDKKNPSITQDYILNFFYAQEVSEVADNGYVTFKIKIDSVRADITFVHPDTSLKVSFNWPNVDPIKTSKEIKTMRDSVVNSDDMIVYRSLIGKEIKARVSPQGELSAVYETETVLDFIFENAIEPVKSEQRETLRKDIDDLLKELIQQQFQKFPLEQIKKDSSWTVNKETMIDVVFKYVNILKYTVSKIENTNDGVIVTILFSPSYKLVNGEYKEKGGKLEIKDIQLNGGGEIKYNLTKGILLKKDSKVDLARSIIQTSGGKTGKLKNQDVMSIKIDKL